MDYQEKFVNRKKGSNIMEKLSNIPARTEGVKLTFADIPPPLFSKWRNTADLIAELMEAAAALIMKAEDENMEVAVASVGEGNPYHPGQKEKWHGLYCETVIKTQDKLIVANALKDPKWDKNPDIKLGMIAYLGLPVNFPDGRPYGTICVLDSKERQFTDRETRLLRQFRDSIEVDLSLLTSQFEAERQNRLVRESQEHLAATLRSIGDGVIACDRDGRVASINHAAEPLTGWTSAAAAGKPIEEVFNIINAQTRGKVENPVFRSLREGVIVGLANHTVLIAKDGVERQIADCCSPIRDSSGTVVGAVLVFRDVTEEYRMQEELRKSEQRFQTMLSVVPDMISIHDPAMNIIYSNWNGFGAVPKEKRVLNSKCYRTYRGFDDICPDCRAAEVVKTRQPFQEEVELPDGKWVDLRVIPIPGTNGSANLFVEWVRDITASKTAEQAIKRSKEELEVINADLERQTLLATEMAVKAEESAIVKQQFLANMSHELRTPLNGVIAPANMLAEMATDPEQRELAEIISTSGGNLLNLVNDILDFSKVEIGAVRLRLSPVAIQDIVERSLVPMAMKAKEKGLTFTTEIDSCVPPAVLADTLRVSQVLLNLAANAVKFTDAGEVFVNVTAVGRLGARTLVRFSVKDTGVGVEDAYQAALFEPFTQADFSDTRKYGGTGLGLAISKQLVELMGGDIGCDSDPGKGSEFWFVLPLEEVEGEAPKAKTAAAAATTGMDFRGLRVLIVEDNPSNSKVAMLALRNMGVERITALDDGAKAIEAMKLERFDLALMDCQMPVMNGYEATRTVRGGNSGVLDGDIPIIAMTANVMEGDREKCLAAGMDDYIAKPITAAKLEEALAKCLQRRSRGQLREVK